jgi:Flp pilus assembly protein TadD
MMKRTVRMAQRLRILWLVYMLLNYTVLSGLSGCGIFEGTRGSGQNAQTGKVKTRGEMQTRAKSPSLQLDSATGDQVALLFERAIESLERGNEERALEDLQQVVALSPSLSVPHNNLGILYKRKGFLDEAIAEYREAIRLKPDYAEAYNNLGIAYREKGLFGEAEQVYLKALRINPGLLEPHFNLGVLYELYLNQPEKAVKQYETYLDRNGPKKEEVKLWIAALQQKLQAIEPPVSE